MILFVDTEHSSGYDKKWGQMLLAARTRIKYRLEDVTGDEVYLVRYDYVTHELIDRLGIRALFLSGSSSVPDDYGSGQLDGVAAVIRSMSLPMFGFCGGFQMMGAALGATLERIGPLESEEAETADGLAPGWQNEFGYAPVPLTASHPILEGLGDTPVMRHAHSWELKNVPDGFSVYAATDVSAIQLIIHDELPVVGTQFHPEYWTEEHPAGLRLIQNFCRFAGLVAEPSRVPNRPS